MLKDLEIQFLSDKSPFLLKNEVDTKINKLLYGAQRSILEVWQQDKNWHIPSIASKVPGKVSKGNNHQGFPYQVFDFPSILDAKSLFSMRTMVWYGNHFSFNLLLKGSYVSYFLPRLPNLNHNSTYLSLNRNIWNVDFSADDRILLNRTSFRDAENYFEKNQSIRLFRVFNMNQIMDINRLTSDCFIDWFKK